MGRVYKPPYFKSKYYTFCLKYFDKSLKYSIFASHYVCTHTNILVSNLMNNNYEREAEYSLLATFI